MREFVEFEILNADLFQYQLVKWGNKFDNFIVLNSNRQNTSPHLYQEYDLMAAVNSISSINNSNDHCFENLKNFNKITKDWIFGYLSYDLKNEIESLHSSNFDGIGFEKLYFFVPRYVFILKKNVLRIEYCKNISSANEINNIYYQIISFKINENRDKVHLDRIKQKFTKNEYINAVEKIKIHIIKGDIYELNLCQEFYIENIEIKPEIIYQRLNTISPSPFSCYMRNFDKYLLCSSPERFLTKRKQKIISQPIKGTIHRSEDIIKDKELMLFLQNNEKEKAENIMIVDLVRNDLSRTAKIGSVNVEELCKIYSFGQVHQMISTISSEIDKANYDIIDLLKTTFPMGSMTGAPKIRAMELIEKFEKTKRGIYSGSVGYISPSKDFDFNVIIRSILYNCSNKYVSFTAGSAITNQSVAEDEYNECILKADAMIKALTL